MKTFNTLFLAGALSLGCGSNASAPSGPADAGQNNTTSTVDSGQSTNPTDAGHTTNPTDAGHTTNPTDSGTTPSGGACGQSLTDAVCMCGMDQNCQNRAITGSSRTCQTCLTTAQTNCCPMEFGAIQTCATTNMCADYACVQMNCATQITAAQTCFNNAQQDSTACQGELTRCFGTFPIRCPAQGS